MRNYQRVEKEAGFPNKNGKLLLTPRPRFSFVSQTVQDFQSSALPTELPAHIK